MEYKTVYSKRKTVALHICPDGSVEVRCPRGVPRDFIDRFVNSHREWIELKQASRIKKQHAINDLDTEKLRAAAKLYIPERTEYFAKIMGVKHNGIKITSAKTRFGSCSAKNSLCFSLYLMSYPKEAIDYVIVHELSHVKEKNHSPAFYKVVASVMPDYKQRKALLKNGVL